MKLTIDRKISLFITILIFTLGAVLGFYFTQTLTRSLSRELDERGRHLLVDLVSDLEYPLLVRDQEAIAHKVKMVVAESDVAFCRIEGKDGTVLYQEGTPPSGPVREFASSIVTSKSGGAAESLILNVPQEKTETVGRAVLLLSLTRLNQRIYEIKKTVTTVVLVAFLIASIGACLLLKRLIGVPVELLVHATERIAGGDLAYKVPHTMKDEFEILGHSFNRMTDSLQEAQEELLHREKLAMLGQLAGGVGNELRNPLGVMNNAVFFLKDALSGSDETVTEYLDVIKNEIDNSHRIISDFIDFFRTKTPLPKPVPVHDLLSACLEKCAIPADVTVTTDLLETFPLFNVDPVQIMQVFQNLITNAVQAMPQGGSLRISARNVSSLEPGVSSFNPRPETRNLQHEGDFIEIAIEDCGPGIAPENMERIFQPLFSTKSRGIGLGLPISKNLVEANGGRIEVASESGKGTVFTVSLPAAAEKRCCDSEFC